MLKPTSNGPIPPASPTKQLILRLAAELARLHDSQSSTLDLIGEARAYLDQPEPKGPTLEEVDDLCAEHGFYYEGGESLELLQLMITDALTRWGK